MSPARAHHGVALSAAAGLTAATALLASGPVALAAVPGSASVTPFQADITAVTAVSASSAWAVGYELNGNDVFVDHWDGASWSAQKHPVPKVSAAFLGASASSASDVWAVGSHHVAGKGGKSWTYLQHYDGSSWSIVDGANPSAYTDVLSAVSARTPSDAWAVGFQAQTSSDPGLPLAEHWNGTRWSAVKTPALDPGCYGGLTGVDALSATNVWAVGTQSCADYSHTLIVHWNGTSWRTVKSPNPGGDYFNLLNTVSMISPTNGWAVGAWGNAKPNTRPLALHWNGTRWSRVTVPTGTAKHCTDPGASLIGVDSDGAHTWAVGGRFCGDDVDTLVLALKGSTWRVSHSPVLRPKSDFQELNAVAVVSGASAFAVGNAEEGTGSIGFAQSWNGRAWTLY